MTFAGALVLTAYLAFVPPEVQGVGTCPSAAEVTVRLEPLLPVAARAGEGAADVVVLEASAAQAFVRLRDPDGRVAQERVLEAGLSCADRATEAAVLVAAWEADLHADVAFPDTEPPRVAPSVPVPSAMVGAPPSASPVPVPAATVSAAHMAPPLVAGPPFEATLGVELLLATPSDAGATPAGSIETTWSRGGRWHGRAAISATGAHTLALPPDR